MKLDPPYDQLHFQDTLPGHTFVQPTGLISWPDGTLAIVDSARAISTFDSLKGPQVVLDLQVASNQDMQVLSAAADPQFLEFPFVYIYYHIRHDHPNGNAVARLSRFPIVNGMTTREDELVILSVPRSVPSPHHYGGEIRFGADGMLYLGIGDAVCYECPQRLDSLHGKIIRIDIRGASDAKPYRIPDDNPFLDVENARPEIWAYGLRNPWRMAFDVRDNELWVGDVGHNEAEEINVVTPGANLGWPAFEGHDCFVFDPAATDLDYMGSDSQLCNDITGTVFPVFTYSHTESQCALIGGTVYRGDAIPWLAGSYLFGDYCSGQIWILEGDSSTGRRAVELATIANSFVSFGSDASGDIYVLTQHGPILRLVEDEPGYQYVPTMTIEPPATSESAATGGA